jgi:Tfp pilus assembly protein PilO
MAGALADFSRRPLQYKVLVFVGIGALLGLLYWQFMLSPLIKERDAAKGDLDAQKQEEQRLRDQKKRYDDLVADETRLRSEIEQNQKALPTESEMPAFFDMLSRKTGEAGIELVKREIKNDVVIEATGGAPPPAAGGAPATVPVAAASFIKVPVDIEVTGTYAQLKKFMASLRPKKVEDAPPDPDSVQEKDRIVTIEQLSILDPKVRNNEIVLTARFTAATFRAKATEPVPGATPPPPPKPATPAAPATGAGAGTGTTAPKAGVSKDPAVMKAKTDAALDASEQRAGSAGQGAPAMGGKP